MSNFSLFSLCLCFLAGLGLTFLSIAIHGLVSAAAQEKFSYTIWTLISALFVYATVCTGIIAYWRKTFLERGENATGNLEQNDSIELVRIQPVSFITNSIDLHRTRQRSRHSPYPHHPAPLNSNPVIGPAYRSSSIIPSYRSMHDNSGSTLGIIPPYQGASTTDIHHHQANPPPFEFPARNRSATDPGKAASQQAAAVRIRANSLAQIKAGFARRMTMPMPASSVAVQGPSAYGNKF